MPSNYAMKASLNEQDMCLCLLSMDTRETGWKILAGSIPVALVLWPSYM